MKKIAAIMIVLIPLLLGGCGKSKADNTATAPQEMAEETAVDDTAAYDAGGEGALTGEASMAAMDEKGTGATVTAASAAQNTGQKLIKDVYLNVETKKFDELLKNLNQKIAELSGYIENSNISGNSYNREGGRSADLTVRIPSDKLDQFVTIVEERSNVTSKSESARDVTLEYIDTSSHVAALRAEQESLMTILESAKKLEDIIKIQSQLTQVRYEIESYESQLRNYDNLVSYSTVTIYIFEVSRETQSQPQGFVERIRAGLSDNLYQLGQSFLDFVVWFVSSLPYLLLWAVVIIILAAIARSALKKWKKRNKRISAQVNGEKEEASGEDKKDENESKTGTQI